MIKVIILTTLFTVVICFNDTIQKKTNEPNGFPTGDVLMQRVTTGKAEFVNHMFFSRWIQNLFYADLLTATAFKWDNSTVDSVSQYLSDIEGERFAFIIPIRGSNVKKFIIGSDLNLRVATWKSEGTVEVSKPVIEFDNKGYEINIAHCDSNGIMFVILNYNLKYSEPEKGTLIYKIAKETSTLVATFPKKVTDFEFSFKFDKMYIITGDGFEITEYDYNLRSAEMSNPKVKFNILEHGHFGRMTSVDVDDANTLWVNSPPYILRISLSDYQIIKVIKTPYKGLTRLTFGGPDSKYILFGTSKQCEMNDFQAGSIYSISGFSSAGHRDEEIVFDD